MGRKANNIYEYLNDYSKKEINNLIYNLSIEDKNLLRAKYGNDLQNPVYNDLSETDKKSFYNSLLPRIKRLLEKGNIPNNDIFINPNDYNIKTQLLKLINDQKTNKEICKSLSLNRNQLYKMLLDLKNVGMMITRKYYSDGSIRYKRINNLEEMSYLNPTVKERTIITDTNEEQLKCMVISDLHFGNKLDRLDLIDRVYNYCIKNNIHIILSGGDLIDGTFSQEEQKISNSYEQLEYLINNYPYDKNILTFSVAGDHDISALTDDYLNIIETCNNYRHDIIIGGYNNVEINIKNDQIQLHHRIGDKNKKKTKAPLILHGHSHYYKTLVNNNKLIVFIPSLSEIKNPIPTALELNMTFNRGYIDDCAIKQIYFTDKDIILSEANYNLLVNRTINYGPIKNTEYKAYTKK